MPSLSALTESWCGKGPWARHGMALGGVVAVTLLRLPLEPLLAGRAPYALYYLPILLSAWHCGVGATITATAASAIMAWLFVIPHGAGPWDVERGYPASMLLFLAVCASMVVMAQAAVRVRRRASLAIDAARRSQQAAKAVVWEWEAGSPLPRPETIGGVLHIEPDLQLSEPEALRVTRAFEQALRAGSEFAIEFPVLDSDRGERWIAASGAVERGLLTGPRRISGLTLDVTGRKRAEQSRERLAAIVDSSEDAIASKSLDGIIRSWNASAERIFGYTAAEIVGRPVTILIPPDRQSEEVEIVSRLRRGERVEHFETVRLSKDGRSLHVSLTISPVRDEAGQIVGASKIVRDITERKRASEELAAQRERYRVTLESIGDAVIATDAQGRVVFMNAVAEALTGLPMAQAEGRACHEVFRIINEDTRLPVEDPVAQVLAEGAIVGLANHTLLIAVDGSTRPIDDSGAPIRNRQGEITGVVLVFRDVTERRRSEAERAEAQAERERLLDSERAARGEAERANRVKDDFVATVSHELRTPLNAILGWTQLLSRPDVEPDILSRGIEVIDRNARVQAQLISDLLDISGIVAGKLRLDFQSVDLARLVEDSIEALRPAAAAKEIELQALLDKTTGSARADPMRLQQVVWNLLSNAVKFTPRGGRVTVQLRRLGDGAAVSVADTGVGIRPEFLESLFERFRQADPSTTRRYGGLGLGLSIVKHLVELHGGTVRAQSDGEGQGSTFTLELPLLRVHDPTRPSRRAPPAAGPDPDPDGSLAHVKVLVVEDEIDARELIARLLQEQRAEVITASSAGEALTLLDSYRPHVLVSDIGLPEVDGYELIRRVRKREAEQGGSLPAIAVTAFARPEDRTRALQAGYHAHICKPIEADELLAIVANLAHLASERG